MSRLASQFTLLKGRGAKALIPFITAGDPSPAATVPVMHALVQAGANILEIGVPFSDPMADGPVIQEANDRALQHNVTLNDVLGMVKDFRKTDFSTPVVLMGYLNPIEAMGYQVFAEQAAKAGVDGVITVDMPPEESEVLIRELERVEVDPIFLMAPTTTPQRMSRITGIAKGFLYYVSLRGVTGAGHLNVNEVSERVAAIREYTSLPVAVGFGVSDPESAANIARVADAVVVGSALIKYLAQYHSEPPGQLAEHAGKFLRHIREAIDASSARKHRSVMS